MASPHVAAAAAMIKLYNPKAAPSEIYIMLRRIILILAIIAALLAVGMAGAINIIQKNGYTFVFSVKFE